MMTAVKEIYEDWQRRRGDDRINNSKVQIWNDKSKGWETKTWSALKVGDIVKVQNKENFPADLILLTSSETTGVCYIETSNLDGETNLKVRQSLNITANLLGSVDTAVSKIKGNIECEGPNKKLYDFNGSLTLNKEEQAPLSTAQLLLRGSKLMNTTFIVGTVVYSGHESKLMKNSQAIPLKDSSIQKMTNIQIIFL